MEKFTASNGISVMRNPDDGPDIDYQSWSIGNALEVLLAPHEVDALREFFQHERDDELGRWRWPKNPSYVVYPDGTSRRVVDEPTGKTMQVSLHDRKAMTTYLDSYVGAAKAYDEAHPEPKPWHDAKHLEIWALTIQGCPSEAYIYREGFASRETAFRPVNHEERVKFSADDPRITAGRRIWPEVSDDV